MKPIGELRIEELMGRQVLSANNHPVGRIEEFRAQRRGQGCVSTALIVGMAGLLERLDVARTLLVGGKRRGYLVRWDQIDVRDPKRPRLTCAVNELEEI